MFRIFLSYRREDAPAHMGRLSDALQAGFGEEEGFAEDQIFVDVTQIEPGADFRQVIRENVEECDVLLAVIGKGWLIAEDSQGHRRLDDPADFVRLEIEAALARNVPVVPVLVNGAAMPTVEEVPDSLSELVYRNAIEVSNTRWKYDVGQLFTWLKQREREKQPAPPGPAKAPPLQAKAQGRPSELAIDANEPYNDKYFEEAFRKRTALEAHVTKGGSSPELSIRPGATAKLTLNMKQFS